ncbi:membrane-associated phosphatidylinositol transfer protein 2-like isoform X1 [Amphiura filiformis]|uniref:membrane-associated phosphatidylinositol transfer protein 2-like isoform X1 n=1 Tax=Amphiura filiformis TaxID=82378 RepID=UPI003B2245B9
MCAYKLCRVEFRYWGMQTRIERFIHDIALKKTMLHAHRQAWVWQDEWYGLTMEDIRELEQEAARELMQKMAAAHMEEEEEFTSRSNQIRRLEYVDTPTLDNQQPDEVLDGDSGEYSDGMPSSLEQTESGINTGKRRLSKRLSTDSRASIASSSQMLAQWRMNSIQQDSESSDEEFFDAPEFNDEGEPSSFETHWSSMEDINPDLPAPLAQLSEEGAPPNSAIPSTCLLSDVGVLVLVLHGGNILDGGQDMVSKTSDINTFQSVFDGVIQAHFPIALGRVVIRLVSCPSTCFEAMALTTRLSPCSSDFNNTNTNYENKALGSIGEFIPLGALPLLAANSPKYNELVAATIMKMNNVYNEFMRSPQGQGFVGQVCVVGDCMGAILGYDALSQNQGPSSAASSQGSIQDFPEPSPVSSTYRSASTSSTGAESNLSFENSKPLSSSSSDLQACGDGTSVDMRQRSQTSPASTSNKHQTSPVFFGKEVTFAQGGGYNSNFEDRYFSGNQLSPDPLLSVQSSNLSSFPKVEFEVANFFMFGSPLGIVLAQRKTMKDEQEMGLPNKPVCGQVYNMFHKTDPSAVRLEPLLSAKFSLVSPSIVERYTKYPLGDGHSNNISDVVCQNHLIFLEDTFNPGGGGAGGARHASLASNCSNVFEMEQGSRKALADVVASVNSKWWGHKRLDFVLYCPGALQAFPSGALPHLFHSSYWESSDAVAFILRQIFQQDTLSINTGDGSMANFVPSQPREKWQRKRTSMKMKTSFRIHRSNQQQNVNPNHRCNDVIALEGNPQVLTGRFMYSSLDMVTLTGEKVDIHIMTQPPSGEWVHFATEVTNSHGRLSYTLTESNKLGQGIYPVKMVVRGDHTSADCYLTVVPPSTECVVFSIDGSFTASVSIMGRDPKVRAGAVDVVRHWQELNYLIIYVTARPSMQKQKVVAWLAQHNFPHGMVFFSDGISTDPLRQKAGYLRGFIDQSKVVIHAAYGSSKDIWVYSSIGLTPSQIYIVGKVSKKYQNQAQVLSGGYAAHLDFLSQDTMSTPANRRIVFRKGCFSLPGTSRHRPPKTPVSRTTSYGFTTSGGNTTPTLTRSQQGSVKFAE